MSIGFGEIFIAFTFLISALIVIYIAKILTKRFLSYHHNKILKLKIATVHFTEKKAIILDIKKIAKVAYEIALEKREELLYITLDMHITSEQVKQLERYLIENQNIESFSY